MKHPGTWNMKGSLLPIILKVLLCARWVREVRHLRFFHSSFSSLGMWFWLCIKMKKFTCHLGFIIVKFIMKQRWEWPAQVHPGFTILPLKISHPVKSFPVMQKNHGNRDWQFTIMDHHCHVMLNDSTEVCCNHEH